MAIERIIWRDEELEPMNNPKGLYWKGRFYTSKKTQAERGYTAQIQPHGHPNWIKAMYNSGHTLMNYQQGKAKKTRRR
ncbi:MAG: hypothetical protein FWC76_02800 [Defluviitaleaceae bacterium]|nr:hypothetical protein [Defluviitaleaceae bacterium]